MGQILDGLMLILLAVLMVLWLGRGMMTLC